MIFYKKKSKVSGGAKITNFGYYTRKTASISLHRSKRTAMKRFLYTLFILTSICSASVEAQENASDTHLSVGGYGEVAMSRNFYSDNVYRYSNPTKYKDDPGHGRFDIPHTVLFIGYDFGNGWSMQSEIEFEHTGTGSSVEKEFTEAGEWEQEIEKGGEVALEQFWLQKEFKPWLNMRIGHFVVPVGALNNTHEPLISLRYIVLRVSPLSYPPLGTTQVSASGAMQAAGAMSFR